MPKSPIIRVVLVLLALPVLSPAAAAAAEGNLYQAEAIVTGQGQQNRLLGFGRALEDVLVKVSGDPSLIGDPAVARLAPQADTFVADFRYHDRMEGIPTHDEQGTRDRPYDLIVSFDPPKIDEVLRSLGREPWAGPRPRLAVFLGMRNAMRSFVVTRDNDRDLERTSLAAAAERRGMPMVLPDTAAVRTAGLDFERLRSVDPGSLRGGARAFGGEAVLVGIMTWDEAAITWVADWRLQAEGRTYDWQIRSETFDEVFRGAMAGAAQILSGNGWPQ